MITIYTYPLLHFIIVRYSKFNWFHNVINSGYTLKINEIYFAIILYGTYLYDYTVKFDCKSYEGEIK